MTRSKKYKNKFPKKEKAPRYKTDYLTVIIVVIALILMLLFGIPSLDYYLGKPLLPR